MFVRKSSVSVGGVGSYALNSEDRFRFAPCVVLPPKYILREAVAHVCRVVDSSHFVLHIHGGPFLPNSVWAGRGSQDDRVQWYVNRQTCAFSDRYASLAALI